MIKKLTREEQWARQDAARARYSSAEQDAFMERLFSLFDGERVPLLLLRAGVYDPAELAVMTDADILRFRNAGRKTLAEIRARIPVRTPDPAWAEHAVMVTGR